jgi:YtkA-like
MRYLGFCMIQRLLLSLFLGMGGMYGISVNAYARALKPTWVVFSKPSHLRVEIFTPAKIPIAKYHTWTVAIYDSNGKPVDVLLHLSGGMPSHGHGLSSNPEIIRLDNGKFQMEGMQFNMAGIWAINMDLFAEHGIDKAIFKMNLNP